MRIRHLRTRLATIGVLVCVASAAMSAVGVGTAGAWTTQDCHWENTSAYPRLWIRLHPDVNSRTLYSVSYHSTFWASPYMAYNDNVHWVELSSGGYANASYIGWIMGGADQQYCQ
jgi:hypothetical protein